MRSEIITKRPDLLIRRLTLDPGEAMPWHTDTCHRFSVVIWGEQLRIEFRDSGEVQDILLRSGYADWDPPESRIHRGVNVGKLPYEEVTVFFLVPPDVEPQPPAP